VVEHQNAALVHGPFLSDVSGLIPIYLRDTAGCLTSSANAAFGVVTTTRAETVARLVDAKAHTGGKATVERAE
jgi:hypothetical protein